MINKIQKYKEKTLVFGLMLLMPVITFAQEQSGIVPCDGDDCGFDDIVQLVNNVIEKLLSFVLPIAALAFMIVGFIYITNGENPDMRKKAKNAFRNLAVGLLIVLAAWLIVFTLLNTLGVTEQSLLDPGN